MPAHPLFFCGERVCFSCAGVLDCGGVCVFDGQGGVGVDGDAFGECVEGCCIEGGDVFEVGDGGGRGLMVNGE